MKPPTQYEDHRGRKFPIRYEPIDASGENEGGKITIDNKRGVEWQARSLYHELLHQACDGFACMTDPIANIEEVIVQNLEDNMTAMMQRNPQVFTWILESLTKGV